MEELEKPDPFDAFVLSDEEKAIWYKIVFQLKKDFGKKPDINGILFLIGMQELGAVREYSKQEKMDLMHVATCRLLSLEGYYRHTHTDEDGWPHFERIKQPPYADLNSQENRLKSLIVKYFIQNELLAE